MLSLCFNVVLHNTPVSSKKLIIIFIYYILFNLEKHWSKPKNQKVFFENFAKEQGFNSRVPDNWYKIPAYTLLCHMVI